jgi:inosine-uridine nucleoside N-ribohydrolase
MAKRKFFIDTDTATDDAVALVMALRHSDIDVLGISTVAGNCTIEQATQNALYTRDLVGSNAPIHVGAYKARTTFMVKTVWAILDLRCTAASQRRSEAFKP